MVDRLVEKCYENYNVHVENQWKSIMFEGPTVFFWNCKSQKKTKSLGHLKCFLIFLDPKVAFHTKSVRRQTTHACTAKKKGGDAWTYGDCFERKDV